MILAMLGDIHGNIFSLDRAIQQAADNDAKALIQVGDFGLMSWRMLDHADFKEVLGHSPIPVYFIDGNHDDCSYWVQQENIINPFDIPNLFYVPRGSVYSWGGLTMAFLGGAASIDKAYRLRNRWHWDKNENISPEQVDRLMQNCKGRTIDILVTHVPPQSVIKANFPDTGKLQFGVGLDWEDPNATIVEDIWQNLGKPLSISGHMHRSVRGPNYQILNIDEVLILDTEDFRKE